MVKIHVLFWGGWNYKPKADKFIEELSKLCTFEATLEKKPGGSGCFEVTIEGTLVHFSITDINFWSICIIYS